MKKEFERAMSGSLCYWVGWPAGSRRYQERGAGTKKAPRLIAAPLRNENRKRVRLLGLLGSFLVGLLGFLCHGKSPSVVQSFVRARKAGELRSCPLQLVYERWP